MARMAPVPQTRAFPRPPATPTTLEALVARAVLVGLLVLVVLGVGCERWWLW